MSQDEIVGHKTFSDGHGGFRHEPLTRAEADALWATAEAAREARAAAMPTEQDAVRVMCSAFQRLKELGWREAMYLSSEKVGTVRLIEPGSSGIHVGNYMGEWPSGSWWIQCDGDMWPSRPCLARPFNEPSGDKRET